MNVTDLVLLFFEVHSEAVVVVFAMQFSHCE